MADYTSLLWYTWGDNQFTYSLDKSNAYYYQYDSIIDNPTNGDDGFVSSAISAWTRVADISFREDNANPEIGFYEATFYDDVSATVYGRTYGIIDPGIRVGDVDVYINNNDSRYYPLQTYKTYVYMHELGHALGLDHPLGAATFPGYSHNTTIMSYNEDIARVPITPMIFDIQAIQSMYGANRSVATGGGSDGDVYTLSGDKVLRTIWDGAGDNDVLRVSPTETRDAVLDLRGGLDENGVPQWSTVGDEKAAIAYDAEDTVTGTVNIEKAIGGGGNDLLIGNVLDNTLEGGSGIDILVGDDGNDQLEGGAGNDIIGGGDGNDVLDGGADNDRLEGGTGDDLLKGGEGDDDYEFATGDGHDTIADSDGVGEIIIDGQQLSGMAVLNSATQRWEFQNHPDYYLTQSGTDMILHKDGDENNDVTIKNFKPGETPKKTAVNYNDNIHIEHREAA